MSGCFNPGDSYRIQYLHLEAHALGLWAGRTYTGRRPPEVRFRVRDDGPDVVARFSPNAASMIIHGRFAGEAVHQTPVHSLVISRGAERTTMLPYAEALRIVVSNGHHQADLSVDWLSGAQKENPAGLQTDAIVLQVHEPLRFFLDGCSGMDR